MTPDPYTSNDSIVFDSWDEVVAYAVEECEDGITIEDLNDACVGIDMPDERLKGFIETVDGNAGVSCETLQNVAEYMESKTDD